MAKSSSKIIGYCWNHKTNEEVLRDGWLDTGEAMKADKASVQGFCGREKQIIVRAGSNICHQGVEEAPLEYAAMVRTGAVGTPSGLVGQFS